MEVDSKFVPCRTEDGIRVCPALNGGNARDSCPVFPIHDDVQEGHVTNTYHAYSTYEGKPNVITQEVMGPDVVLFFCAEPISVLEKTSGIEHLEQNLQRGSTVVFDAELGL